MRVPNLLPNHRRINGLTHLNLTKLDVLSELDTIQLCTAYRLGRRTLTSVPAEIEDLEAVEAVYENLPGWQEDISQVRGRGGEISHCPESRLGGTQEGDGEGGRHAWSK